MSASLAWTPSGSHDEDLSHYANYRGEIAGFPLDDTHRIGTIAEITYVDPAGVGTWYYRVTAVESLPGILDRGTARAVLVGK